MHNSGVSTLRRPRKILLTGFEPFGGERVNPSLEVARALDGARVGGAVVVSVGLPVVYAEAAAGLLRAVASVSPGLVLGLGQCAGAAGLRLERVAVNLSDSTSPDNAGVVLRHQPVVADGPDACLATLPLARMHDALVAAGFPVAMSTCAGRYVCNHAFYALLHHLADHPVPAGFVHLPLLPDQAAGRPDTPSLPLARQVDAVRAALEAACAG